MKRDLRYEVDYPHPIEKVWRALTDRDAIAAWLMPNTFVPERHARFQFRTKPAPGFSGIVDCEVLEIDPPNHLRYSWKGGGIDTILAFTLTRAGDGTRMVLEHTGFRGVRPLLISLILGSGWKKVVFKSIPAYLEKEES
jgi:uncharacterized protein YndB with AHSA1/START domain